MSAFPVPGTRPEKKSGTGTAKPPLPAGTRKGDNTDSTCPACPGGWPAFTSRVVRTFRACLRVPTRPTPKPKSASFRVLLLRGYPPSIRFFPTRPGCPSRNREGGYHSASRLRLAGRYLHGDPAASVGVKSYVYNCRRRDRNTRSDGLEPLEFMEGTIERPLDPRFVA